MGSWLGECGRLMRNRGDGRKVYVRMRRRRDEGIVVELEQDVDLVKDGIAANR